MSYLVRNNNNELINIIPENQGLRVEKSEFMNPPSVFYRNITDLWYYSEGKLIIFTEEDINDQFADLALEFQVILEKRESNLALKTETIAKEISKLCQCPCQKKG